MAVPLIEKRLLEKWLVNEEVATVDADFRVQIPEKGFLERLELDAERRYVLAGKSEDCVIVWTYAEWQAVVQPRIDAVLDAVRKRHYAVVRLDHSQTVCRMMRSFKWHRVDEKRRIKLPEEFRGLVEQGDHKRKLRNVVNLVGCGPRMEIWRPSAWSAFRETQWPRFWEAIDALTTVTSSDG